MNSKATKALHFPAILLVSLLFMLASCGNDEGEQQRKEETPVQAKKQQAEIPISQNLEGSINKTLGIHMQLERKGDSLSGKYFYDYIRADIPLKGVINNDNNELRLTEFDGKGNITGKFTGKVSEDGNINGQWSKPDGSRPMPFDLKPSAGTYEQSRHEAAEVRYEKYDGEYEFSNDYRAGSADIKHLGKHDFSFALVVATAPGCIAEVEGKGRFTDKSHGVSRIKNCELKFEFKNNTLIIDEISCLNYHGAGCSFDGEYRKETKPQKNQAETGYSSYNGEFAVNRPTFSGTLNIRYTGNDSFSFDMLGAKRTACVGKIDGGKGYFTSENEGRTAMEDCDLRFTFSKDTIQVQEVNCTHHGASCHFSGAYVRKR